MPVRNVTRSNLAKRHPRSRRGRFALWLSVSLIGCLAILLAVSYLLDPTIRSWAERNMNARLKGYETHLGGAHLNLVDFTLTLRDLKLIQKLHPRTPVAQF